MIVSRLPAKIVNCNLDLRKDSLFVLCSGPIPDRERGREKKRERVCECEKESVCVREREREIKRE